MVVAMELDITWATLSSKSQSLVSSLWINLLLTLNSLWHMLQSVFSTEIMKYSDQTSSEPLEVLNNLTLKGIAFDSHADDSCSGYCSGSGSSSLPGSPLPDSCMKSHVSSDEHENDENDGEEAQEEVLQINRRDSDSSTTSDCSETNVTPETIAKIVAQVESMFSDEHLAKDGFLLKHVRRRSDGFVSLKLVAGLRKVKQISREFPVVLNALKVSEKMEVNTEGTKIRRKEPLTTTLKSMPIKQAKKDKNQTDKDTEKENQVQVGGENNHPNKGSHLNDEQQIARKRRTNNGHRSSIPSDDLPLRRRGGSLPIPSSVLAHRGSIPNYMYTIPLNGEKFLRPKSNSYSEGTDPTMSSWLQKRKASAASSRLSTGEISLNGVIRQPRGPDGTTGFQPGYRNLIIEERYILS